MKKLVMALMMLLATVSFTQEISSHLDIGLEGGMPVGDTKDLTTFGLGATVKGSFPLGRTIDLTGRAGYIWWAEGEYKEDHGVIGIFTVNSELYHIPIMAGVRLKSPGGLYGMVELGVTVIGGTMKEAIGGVTILDKDIDESEFGYSIGAGYLASNLDFSVTYNSFNEWNHIGFRIGFLFM
jgi:hypothetical protein